MKRFIRQYNYSRIFQPKSNMYFIEMRNRTIFKGDIPCSNLSKVSQKQVDLSNNAYLVTGFIQIKTPKIECTSRNKQIVNFDEKTIENKANVVIEEIRKKKQVESPNIKNEIQQVIQNFLINNFRFNCTRKKIRNLQEQKPNIVLHFYHLRRTRTMTTRIN